MTDKAYQYINWAQIEGLIYSEERHPKAILAPRAVKEGILYQCFLPGVKDVYLKELRNGRPNGRSHKMIMEDEIGYFACILPGKKPIQHSFVADGVEIGDPYVFANVITDEEAARFQSGIAANMYKRLGAHRMEIDGQKGILFAVWAPNALRVSVVGDFNSWDGRMFPMEYCEESGIFELFIPALWEEPVYAYEIKLPDGLTYIRPDPYGNGFVFGEKNASVCADLSYRWHDRSYLTSRHEAPDSLQRPVAIYKCSLADFADQVEEICYRELADVIISHVAELGYTHICLEPIMEYPEDSSNGYQSCGYFAPTERYGKPVGFKYFVDRAHERGIGVILTWTPDQFASTEGFMASFDGTCLYEHLDARQGVHPRWGSKLYNYGRGEVRSFLLSSARFWMREYHIDGLFLNGCETMLKLDYYRGEQWVANMYGTSEHLEGIAFLKQLAAFYKKEFPDGILMMAEQMDYPEITAALEDDGFGFDYKLNLHFAKDMHHYLSQDAKGRVRCHEELLNGMLHHYMEHFVIGLADENASDGADKGDRQALLRCALGFLFCHAGKKMLLAHENADLPYLKDLLGLYHAQRALWYYDYDERGFEWINTMDGEHSVLSFVRKSDRRDDALLVVCNFSDAHFEDYRVGVPYEGCYKEIFNSDAALYGGSGAVNARARASRPEECDEREHSLKIRLAPRTIAVFAYRRK